MYGWGCKKNWTIQNKKAHGGDAVDGMMLKEEMIQENVVGSDSGLEQTRLSSDSTTETPNPSKSVNVSWNDWKKVFLVFNL